MRSFASTVLGAAIMVVLPVAAGFAPALSQDFSITNQVEPADAARRDVMRQLQAWWDLHAFYPKHASQSDEGGSVKLRLDILTDGRIWAATVVEGSGSSALDSAAVATFHGGFVRPFAADAPPATITLSLTYVLAHRHDRPVAAAYTPLSSKRPFTITNDPVTSPILETMLQRTCTGEVVKEGIRNHPIYGGHHWIQAVFFRKPEDGTPWVKFYDGHTIFAPVSQVGRLVQWTGHVENPHKNAAMYYQCTLWPAGDNKLTGNIEGTYADIDRSVNRGGTVDLVCETELVPAIAWTPVFVDRTFQIPSSDPP